MKNRTLATLALLALCAPPAATAGVNRWTPFGDADSWMLDLLPGPEGLYAVAGDGRVFRSTDSGVAWQYWGVGLGPGIERIAADPADPRRLTAVSAYADVYRSVDAGRFWSPLPQRVEENLEPEVAALASAAGTVYVGGRVLYVSHDNGEAWIGTTPVQARVADIAVDPADPRAAWFASATGLWKTADAGGTFALVLDPPHETGGEGITAVGIAPSRPSTVYAAANRRLYASRDGGATWQAGSPIGIGDVAGLAVDPAAPARVCAAGPGGIALSQDGGATWTVAAPHLASTAVAFAPGALFAATAADGLHASADGGRSWPRRSRVGLGYASTFFVERDPRRPSVLYLDHAASGFGFLRSLDDGRTWAPFSNLTSELAAYLTELAFDKRRPGVLYTASFIQGAWRIEPNGKARRMAVPGTRDMNTVVTSGRAVLVGSTWGGYRSEDGGETWKEVLRHNAGGRIERRVERFVEDPLKPGTVYALTTEQGPDSLRNVALRSDDTGIQWRPIRTGALHVLAADPLNPGVLYSVETEGEEAVLYWSGDRGDTWRRIGPIPGPPQGRVTALVADTKHSAVLWAASDTDVLRSEDGGRNWEPFNAGLARPGLTALFRLASDPGVPGRLYAMPIGGGLFELTTP